jgi:hypothetical protein
MAAMALATCVQMPVRVPALSPVLYPAQETSWQGNPAVSRSTGGMLAQSTRAMSPRFGMPGWRTARTALAAGLFSATHMRVAGQVASAAMSRPPYPVHKLPARIS